MTIYAKVGEFDIVDHYDGFPDPPDMEGPLPPPPPGEGWMLINTMPGPRPHKDFAWKAVDGVMFWYDPRNLADVVAGAAAAVDQHADVARASVVGDAVRVKEYERAQAQAEAFRAAGFAGAVPSCVACWAAAKEWTPQSAAEDILAAAARWYGALDGIRALRLQAKEDIRRAADNATVDTLLATFIASLTSSMQGVQ